jgi:hypothetical protein
MITNTQYLVLRRLTQGKKPLCGHDMLFNLAHKELVKTEQYSTVLSLSNKGKAAMDKYESKQ